VLVTHQDSSSKGNRQLLGIALGALGVVYGDIGTSPLYALRECFDVEKHGVDPSRVNVLGVLSLVFWTLIVIVTVKYLIFVMRADNRGEGGILALMSLVPPNLRDFRRGGHWVLLALGLFGAALLYGDGMIIPSISVLSAVEGLHLVTSEVDPFVVPITIAILIGLFVFQRRGTAGIGKIFGPVMLVWFATLAAFGLIWVLREPGVLAAVNPAHAVRFFLANGWMAFLAMGSVFLVATGSETLYADMGHFGKRPIRAAWFALVMPALLLNYFGQGALLLHLQRPASTEEFNPFFQLAGENRWALYYLVGLATVATVIASQAVISGAFSLTRQAVQLGYMPRLEIIHTSEEEIGQIYIPSVNWFLMVSTIGLVLGFQKSTNLAGAYGVAVTTTMVITTLLAQVVARRRWGWNPLLVVAGALFFLAIEVSFFGANIIKIAEGGWLPLLVGTVVYTLLSTWKKGRAILADRLKKGALPFTEFIATVTPTSPPRVPGTAVFMSRDPEATPTALLHNLKHNKVLHEKVVLLTVMTEEVPYVDVDDRVRVEDLGKGFFRVIARYGFLQTPGVSEVIDLTRAKGLDLNVMNTTFFLSRETLIPSKKPGMALWREKLFSLMSRNAQRPTDFFRIPPNRVVELGMQVRL
jgi:KUP system potassium uptake protein